MALKVSLLLLGAIAATCSGRVYETEDTVVVEANTVGQDRQQRQLDAAAWPRERCWDNQGQLGTCVSFRQCYPDAALRDSSQPDNLIAEFRGTCRYVEAEGRQTVGVCCSRLGSSSSSGTFATAGSVPGFQAATPFQLPAGFQTAGFHQGISSSNQGFVFPFFPTLGSVPQGSQTNPWAPFQFPGFPGFPAWIIPAAVVPPSGSNPPPASVPATTTTTTTTTTIKPPLIEPVVAETTTTAKPATTTTTTTTTTAKPAVSTQAPSATFDGTCGKGLNDVAYTDEDNRIVGGQDAPVGAWPFIVALFKGPRQFCGGSIVDNIHILTAAHCIAHMSSWDVSQLTVAVNMHKLKSDNDGSTIRKRVRKITRHRGFDARTLYNDIAILTLDSPITFNDNVSPICLPSVSYDAPAGLKAVVVGWGSLKEGGRQPEVLQQVAVTIKTNDDCRKNYGSDAPGGIVDHFLCASDPGKDSCSGDSGGPLVVRKSQGESWTQVGIVSWGIGCGQDPYPGVYTRVTSFLDWINKNLA